MSILSHRRSRSRDVSSPPTSPHNSHFSPPPRSPSPPTQTFHPTLPTVPTPALLESVAGGAHYSGIRVDPNNLHKSRRRRSSVQYGPEDINSDHRRILDDLQELYCLRPTLEIFERSWRKDAIFEDPLVVSKGYGEFAAQFFALPKLFSKSETIASRVMSSTNAPNRIIYHQKQKYTFNYLGRTKVIESIIIVDLDEDDKIVRVTDQWDGKDLPSWFGSGFLRLLNAKVTPWLVRVPKLAS